MRTKIERGKIKFMHSTHHQPSVTQEMVVEYEFEISEDLTLLWMMSAISWK